MMSALSLLAKICPGMGARFRHTIAFGRHLLCCCTFMLGFSAPGAHIGTAGTRNFHAGAGSCEHSDCGGEGHVPLCGDPFEAATSLSWHVLVVRALDSIWSFAVLMYLHAWEKSLRRIMRIS